MKDIPGFPGYLVDEAGCVWTAKRKGGNARVAGQRCTPRQLALHRNRSGYLVVSLDLGGKVHTRLVHRLVLETFVGPHPDGMEACHYPDPSRVNNCLANLRWDTKDGNAKDKYRDKPLTETKVCRRCGETRPIGAFYGDARAWDGLQGECRACHNAVAVATRDPAKKRAANRDYMRRRRLAVSTH